MNTTSNTTRSTFRRLAAGLAEGWNDLRLGQRRQAELNMPWTTSRRTRTAHR